MIAASPLLITHHALSPIVPGWRLAAGTLAGLCLDNRRRDHRHGTHV